MAKTKRISEMSPSEIKEEVAKAYAKVAQRTTSCCGSSESSCGTSDASQKESLAKALGYPVEELPDSVTESFAGCGNPVALADLREGEIVLDLGSGAGLDAFMAAKIVGKSGCVIGVDMTSEMILKAQSNATKLGITNVEFRQGDIEDLPVEDNSIDAIISNCVINLAPDKIKVFQEGFRVLRSGGRMFISDIVLEAPLPKEIREQIQAYTGCLAGAILKEDYLKLMRDAGFEDVRIIQEAPFGMATSAKIKATKGK
ncbi:MAG: arsenite methyltransferase [Promethearchaeota archaeon]